MSQVKFILQSLIEGKRLRCAMCKCVIKPKVKGIKPNRKLYLYQSVINKELKDVCSKCFYIHNKEKEIICQ